MSLADDTRGFEHRFIDANGVKLHVVVGGGGPLVMLLHGWPECWATWRHVLQPLKDAGFTVAACDLRGFNLSEKPPEVSDYKTSTVCEDIAALIKTLGFQKAHVIGHDWGGAVAWRLAQQRDDVVDKLVVINCPHPGLFAKRLARSPKQLKSSYYMFVFQVPWLAEKLLSRDDFQVLVNMMRYQPKKKGAFDDEDVRVFKEAMGQPGAVTSSLNYYRAAFREAVKGKQGKQGNGAARKIVERPTMILWGMDDAALNPEALDGHENVARDLKIVRLESCSHWVQHDKPEAIVEESVKFFRA